MDIGRYGIWSAALRVGDPAVAAAAAAELDELGYGAIWLPGRSNGIWERARAILAATRSIKVATGIVSIWQSIPQEAADATQALREEFEGRFVLGLGVSHGPIVDKDEPGRYRRPYSKMVEWLDELDALPNAVSQDGRMLAANHPRMLGLAAERSLGSHTYLVPPAHTRAARALLGAGPLLVPEQSVVLESDPERARAIARQHLNNPYMGLPNYTRNWVEYAVEESDLEDGGSDRLVDAIVAWGDVDRVAARLREHHDAGADHVCIQVLDMDRAQPFRDQWRRLAEVLLG